MTKCYQTTYRIQWRHSQPCPPDDHLCKISLAHASASKAGIGGFARTARTAKTRKIVQNEGPIKTGDADWRCKGS